ncbi:MAG: hypothetical protein RIB93_25250 [Coleofasciculus sp. D1-CHI-01]
MFVAYTGYGRIATLGEEVHQPQRTIPIALSRVLLAMGRRRDMPRIVARLNAGGTIPYISVICIGVAIAALVLIANVKITGSFRFTKSLT